MAVAQSLSQYLTSYGATVAEKPADAATIPDQQATVWNDGTVSIVFRSNDPVKVQALRDWLTTVLGS